MQSIDLNGKVFGDFTIKSKEVFNYVDPVSDEVSNNQGIQIFTNDGTRIFFRLSGTGTIGATLRLYIEKYESNPEKFDIPVLEYLKDVFLLVDEIFEIHQNFGDIKPSAIN